MTEIKSPEHSIRTIRTLKAVPAPVGGMAIHRLRDHISYEHLSEPARLTRHGVEYPLGDSFLLIPWANVAYVETLTSTAASTSTPTSKASSTKPKKKSTTKPSTKPSTTPDGSDGSTSGA